MSEAIWALVGVVIGGLFPVSVHETDVGFETTRIYKSLKYCINETIFVVNTSARLLFW